MFTADGDAVTPYDYIRADAVEDGDHITIDNDILESVSVFDETDTIMIRGESLVSGDSATYFLTADAEVGLWHE